MTDSALRDALTKHGRSLYDRGYAHGSSGNLSVRVDDEFIITPTGTSLGRLDPSQLSRIAADGRLIDGPAASKELFLHLAVYKQRPGARAIVHLHCTCAAAVACLVHTNPANVFPPLTAYHVMRVGVVPLIEYFRPGDHALAAAVEKAAIGHRAMLLANHGPVVSGAALDDAVDSSEELEQTARLLLLLRGHDLATLTPAQVADVERHFPG